MCLFGHFLLLHRLHSYGYAPLQQLKLSRKLPINYCGKHFKTASKEYDSCCYFHFEKRVSLNSFQKPNPSRMTNAHLPNARKNLFGPDNGLTTSTVSLTILST